MTNTNGYSVPPVGFVRSCLKHRAEAPKQGSEGAPEAWVEVIPTVMDVLHPRCCGLDVHKNSISACILVQEAGRVQKHQRRFGAMTQDLQELANWLRQFEATQ